MSSRGGVFQERGSVQVECQIAEERKHPTVRGGGRRGCGWEKSPVTVMETAPSVRRCRRRSTWGSEQRVPAEAETGAAVRGRMSAGVVLTSPAAESYWTKERSAGSLFKQQERGWREEMGMGALLVLSLTPKLYSDPPRAGEIQEVTEAGAWLRW